MDASKYRRMTVLKKAFFLVKGVFPAYSEKRGNKFGIILQYHSVCGSNGKRFYHANPTLCIHPKDFEKQMVFVKSNFDVMPMNQFIENLQVGPKGQKPPMTITFDDGYRDNYHYAFPVLRKHRLPAMFYLTTDCIDGNYPLWTSELQFRIMKTRKELLNLNSINRKYSLLNGKDRLNAISSIKNHIISMSFKEREEFFFEIRKKTDLGIAEIEKLRNMMLNWDQIRQMKEAGMSFGLHTQTHPCLTSISAEEARFEINGSKKTLESNLDEEAIHFSYPNPGGFKNFNEETRNMLIEAGIKSATTSVFGYANSGDDLLTLKRIGIYKRFSELPEFNYWIWKNALIDMGKPLIRKKIIRMASQD